MKQLVRLCVPVLFCSVVFAGCSTTQPSDLELRGTVSEIRSNTAVSGGVSLLVSSSVPTAGLGSPVWVALGPSAEVYLPNGRGTIADIKVGASILAFLDPIVLDSYPAQTSAKRIQVNLQ